MQVATMSNMSEAKHMIDSIEDISIISDSIGINVYIKPITKVLISDHHNISLENNFKRPKVCLKPKRIDGVNIDINNKCILTHENKEYHTDEYAVMIKINNKSYTSSIYICKDFYGSLCDSKTYFKISKSDFEFKENRSVKVKKNMILQPSQYIPLKDDILICENSADKQSWIILMRNIEYYVSYIGTLTSILCYIVLIMKYIASRANRSIWHH